MQGKKDSTAYCWVWRYKGPGAKEGKQPLKAGKGKEMHSPLEPLEGTLILAQWDLLQTSDLQNCKVIHLCCFKQASLWSFVIAAIRKVSEQIRKWIIVDIDIIIIIIIKALFQVWAWERDF